METGTQKKHRVVCLYLYNETRKELIESLAEACFRFTPQVAVRSQAVLTEAAIFLEIGGCSRLYSEQLLKMKLTTLAKRFGLLSRIAIGDSAGEAFALVRNSNYFYLEDLPLEALADFLTPFGSDPDAEKRIVQTVQVLKTLGLKNAGEFATIPPRTLASRFGKEAVDLSARVRKQLELAWPGFHPSALIIEKSPVENSENLEALGFVIKGLVDRVIARLHGRSERVSILQLDLELVKWGRRSSEEAKSVRRELRLELPIPQGSTAGLFPIIQEHLSRHLQGDPLIAPVDSMEIKVLEAVPSRGAQKDFFSRKEEESEVWDSLVARLSLKIGAGRVFTATPVKRYLPEKAYGRLVKKQPNEAYFSASAPLWPHRPTRLLKHPRPVERDPSWTMLDGPERLSGEWWNSSYEGFFRDYYRVKTVSGEQLWVFVNRKAMKQEGAAPAFYLHGYFD
jgi:protein ImuB